MQNDMLKNTIAPWQEKGRWYHGVFDTATFSFVTEKTDKFILDNLTTIYAAPNRYLLPGTDKEKYVILDLKIISPKLTNSLGSGTISTYYYYTSSGKLGYVLYPSNYVTAGLIEFWVFVTESHIND